MGFDFSKLNGRIVEKFGTRAAFAVVAGFSESALSYRLNGKIHFDSDEIFRIIAPDCLDLSPADIPVYFFTPKVL